MVRYRIDGAVIAIGMKPTTPVPGSAIGPQQGRPPLEAAFSRRLIVLSPSGHFRR
jgi:hypothetical protein